MNKKKYPLDQIGMLNWRAKIEREHNTFKNEVLVPFGLFLITVLVFWLIREYK